jgi:flagellin-like protein
MKFKRNGVFLLKKTKKKGISPLIASVLLIMFVIALSTIIVNWLKDYAKDQTDATTTMTEENVDCIKQAITISNVYMVREPADSNQTVRVVIENMGTGPAEISNIRVYNDEGQSCELNSSMGTDLIGAGDLITFETDNCAVIFDPSAESTDCHTRFSEIRATTTCGNMDPFRDETKITCTTN